MMDVRARARAASVATAVALTGLAAASLRLPAAPSYDAWAWLLWGREVAHLDLSTAEGPAFKPLPVAVDAVLSVTGTAAPALWLVVARTGALAAVVLAAVVAAGLAREALGERAGRWPWPAGVAAAAGVACTERFVRHAAIGDAEPMMLALALGAFACARRDRHGAALGLAVAAALLRPETWPFVAAYGLWRWRAQPGLRVALAAAAVLVPVAWFVPEWLGSGQLLRSTDRALVPNPGAPALADRPALETLTRAAGMAFVPALIGLLGIRTRGAALVAAAAAAWLLLVAAMSEAGFSGEERYALPGVALLAVAGAAGGVRLLARHGGRLALAAAVALLCAGVAGAVARTAELAPTLAYGAALAGDLPRAIDAAGGREALLGCGAPAVGRYRGPLLAYQLGVEKRRVRADGTPAAVSFRSRLSAERTLNPPSAGGARTVVATARWRIEARCDPAAYAANVRLVRELR